VRTNILGAGVNVFTRIVGNSMVEAPARWWAGYLQIKFHNKG